MGLQREIREADDEKMREQAARAEDARIIEECTGDDSDFHGFGHGHLEQELTPEKEREIKLRRQLARQSRYQE